jgi:hypothetical protein
MRVLVRDAAGNAIANTGKTVLRFLGLSNTTYAWTGADTDPGKNPQSATCAPSL